MPEPILLESAALRLRVSPQGGAVIDGFTQDGRPFLRPCRHAGDGFDPRDAACFPLVPIGNRVAGNAFTFDGRRYAFQPNTNEPYYIHGDGWLSLWAVDSVTSGEVRLSFGRAATAASPYVYEAVQTIRLDGAQVHLHLSVVNRGAAALPFGIGFHPFFPRDPDVRLRMAAGAWWLEGENPPARQAGEPSRRSGFHLCEAATAALVEQLLRRLGLRGTDRLATVGSGGVAHG